MKRTFVSILFACCGLSCMAQLPTLSIEGGKIQGVNASCKDVVVYKGIPYAAPPVGDLRWKKPQPVKPWTGIKVCDKYGAASLQDGQPVGSPYWIEFYQGKAPKYSEDCLYLNVWAPAKAPKTPLPVMVWIHGGSFTGGYSHEIEFRGEKYPQKGVILVTINYRLGMCGFLAHPLLKVENGGKGSGNYGLFDQLAALKWVKKNIAQFGGDPNNVTVCGQSAGAKSVQSLISTPLSKGYINRAIIQSGGGLGPNVTPRPYADAEKAGKELWDEAGVTTLEQMRKMPASEFKALQTKYQQTHKGGRPFYVCVDGEMLTDTYEHIAKAGNELNIPYMIGFCTNDNAPAMMKKAAEDWALLQEQQGRKPTYVYCFSRTLPDDGSFTDTRRDIIPLKGSFHSSELWYMFGTLDNCWRPMEEVDYALSDIMVNYWTNFVKYGNPNGKGLPIWNAYTKSTPYIQTLNETIVGK